MDDRRYPWRVDGNCKVDADFGVGVFHHGIGGAMTKGNGSADLFDPKALPEGGGEMEMVVFEHDGQVIMRFREDTSWVAFDPSNAVNVAKAMIDSAVALGANVEIMVPRREVTREQRAKLITRVGHIYRSMSEKNRPLPFIASQVVDTLLEELA